MKNTRLLAATAVLTASLITGATLPPSADGPADGPANGPGGASADGPTGVSADAWDPGRATAPAEVPPAKSPAEKILANDGISLPNVHASASQDKGSTAQAGIKHSATDKAANTSRFAPARAKKDRLNRVRLNALHKLNASKGFTFRVTLIAGSTHSPDPAHDEGRALDADAIDGSRVSPSGQGLARARKFLRTCTRLGGRMVLGPTIDSAHRVDVHCQW
ncbi:hypothetical protein [Streptomyces yaizuensis]|uniref:Carboxypeptidase n=1 Tax=Streptomyces yaizuensis TaxID=2989713 RepID=A0ABQ5P5Q8_9ACTN|nr:hypothetical protein [Streptomyces sp. YSPA8]GLF97936.1 carboxypeptidase [Streptomyces sp. YSPA8]